MITEGQREKIEEFVEAHKEETVELLKELARIPAPTFQEEKKAAFVLDWLKRTGASEAYIDEAGNVVYEYGDAKETVVFMAHLDVVFADLEPFTIREEGSRLYAPGIGDDNANLANLLMGVKYVLENRPKLPVKLLFVANVCEEGLGNLKGSKYIYEKYGEDIKEFIGFDAEDTNEIVNLAVGSQRYKVTVKTEGGHSYNAFGNDNAIYELSCIIQKLYEIQVPTEAKTTYNVGVIEGGTTINSIAGEASMLYEFRSENVVCLAEMEKKFNGIIEEFQKNGLDVQVEVLGIRPCGKGVDEDAQHNLTKRHEEIIRMFAEREPNVQDGSTDANTFLSHGIPSVVIGTMTGEKAHTREEWMDKESMVPGQKIGLASIAQYFE